MLSSSLPPKPPPSGLETTRMRDFSHVQYLCELVTVAKSVLAADVNRHATIGLRDGKAALGLHERMDLTGSDISIFNAVGAERPSCSNISKGVFRFALEIASIPDCDRLGVDRSHHIIDDRQRLVVYIDKRSARPTVSLSTAATAATMSPIWRTRSPHSTG